MITKLEAASLWDSLDEDTRKKVIQSGNGAQRARVMIDNEDHTVKFNELDNNSLRVKQIIQGFNNLGYK